MSSSDLLDIHLRKGPHESTVKTSSGAIVPGVTNITVHQEAGESPEVVLNIELFSLCVHVYADQCLGKLDSTTVHVLKRLPARVLASLAREMQGMAEAQQCAEAPLDQTDNARESL